MRSAVLTFFDSYPPKTGSGRVCFDFFNSWPSKEKKLFQFTNKKFKKKNIVNILIKKNNPFNKLLNLFYMIKKVDLFLGFKKNRTLIIEGPSWIFYSFLVTIYFRNFRPDIILIYRSHSVEYEIRKKNSNYIIAFMSKIFENFVINNCHISTTVSINEQKKFKNLYDKKTYLFPNSLNIKDLKNLKTMKIKRKLPKKFVLFCGSYDYQPNKEAINFIIKQLMPKFLKKKIFLVITGNHTVNFHNKNIINLKFVKSGELKYLHNKSICLLVPIFEGYGTRIKILESLIWGNRIISTKKGIEGIQYKKNDNIIITNNKKIMLINILKFSLKKKKKIISEVKNFSMELNSKKLFSLVQTHHYEKKNN
jgi:hypothetical protein